MVEFRWIKMSLFLMLVLHFTAADTGQLYPSFTAGDDATLSCENVINDQNNCDSTTWIFSGPESTEAVELITLGQIGQNVKTKSDRLSVTANCSLVIKKVTVEDVGRYTCRQFISGQQQGPDSQVYLSVFTSWWRFIIVSVCLAALIITVVVVNIWTRTKGKKSEMGENRVGDDEDDGTVNYENITSSDGV